MIPMPNSGLADPVNWGLGMGLRGCRVRGALVGLGWLAAGLGRLSGVTAIYRSDRGRWGSPDALGEPDEWPVWHETDIPSP
jgi:hypothetical protein